MHFFAKIKDVLARNPGLPALHSKGIWYTWQDVSRVADALDVALMRANFGVGARIGVVARNRMPHVACLYGLLASGRTAVMLYSATNPQALAGQIKKLRLPAVLADAEDWTSETIAAARSVGTLALQPTVDPATPVLIVADSAVPCAGQAINSASIAIEMLSSGTTGPPKRIPIRWDTLRAAVEDAVLNFRESGQEGYRDGQPVPFVQPAPLANIGGLYAVIPSALEGRPLVLLEKFTVQAWLDAVVEHRPQVAWLAPASIQALWDAQVPSSALASIVGLRTGSAPLSSSLQRGFEEKYSLSILVTYGATEFCGVIVMWTLEDHKRFAAAKTGSVGRPRPGVRLRVVDAHDNTAPAGATGTLEILVPRLDNDWIRTTDLACIDADGFLFLHGRSDDAINRGGFKVMPDAVTEAIRRHPAVLDAAVVGMPQARLGEVPVAAVVLRDGASLGGEELRSFLRDSLLAYQVPAQVLYVDMLPRTPSLKIDRPAVRALFGSSQ